MLILKELAWAAMQANFCLHHARSTMDAALASPRDAASGVEDRMAEVTKQNKKAERWLGGIVAHFHTRRV